MNPEAEWFLTSPIGSADGAYVSVYRNSSRGPVYGEITAYAISMACVWYRRGGDARFLERAKTSAAYLLQAAPAGVRGPTDGRIYTFDTGIFATALLDLFAASGEDRYLFEARHRLDWLLERSSGGSPAATVPEEGGHSGLGAWPLRRSVHLAKMGLPLLKGWRATGEERYREGAARLFDWALALQRRDGRFAIDERNASTMTHLHCYAAEALLYAAWALNDDDLRAAFDNAVTWLADTQNTDGSFYRWYGRFDGFLLRTKVSDATAQALRLWRMTGTHSESASRAEGYLKSVAKEDGGLPNYVRALGPIRWRQRAVCSWPTFFWHHALSIDFGDARATEELF